MAFVLSTYQQTVGGIPVSSLISYPNQCVISVLNVSNGSGANQWQ